MMWPPGNSFHVIWIQFGTMGGVCQILPDQEVTSQGQCEEKGNFGARLLLFCHLFADTRIKHCRPCFQNSGAVIGWSIKGDNLPEAVF